MTNKKGIQVFRNENAMMRVIVSGAEFVEDDEGIMRGEAVGIGVAYDGDKAPTWVRFTLPTGVLQDYWEKTQRAGAKTMAIDIQAQQVVEIQPAEDTDDLARLRTADAVATRARFDSGHLEDPLRFYRTKMRELFSPDFEVEEEERENRWNALVEDPEFATTMGDDAELFQFFEDDAQFMELAISSSDFRHWIATDDEFRSSIVDGGWSSAEEVERHVELTEQVKKKLAEDERLLRDLEGRGPSS